MMALLLCTGACAENVRTEGWAGSVDTLEGGVVAIHNPATGSWDSTSAWRVIEEHRIGSIDSDGPDAFGLVWSALEDALGRTWVLDQQAVAIHVFDSTGAWLRTVGREGGGPGELRRPLALVRAPDGRMWVVDPGNARYSVFDTTGAYVRSWRREVSSSSVPWPGGIDERGRLYDFIFTTVPERTRSLVRQEFRDSAAVVDTIRLPDPPAAEDILTTRIPGGFMTVSIPWGSRYIWSFVPDGRVLYGMTRDYRVHFAPIGAAETRIVEREYTPAPVTAAQRQEALQNMQGAIEQGADFSASMIPDTHPAIDAFFLDDRGYLWVQPHEPAMDGDTAAAGLRLVSWDIFDPDGRYLGPLHGLPPRIDVRGAAITGFTTDELGVPYVVTYRIRGR